MSQQRPQAARRGDVRGRRQARVAVAAGLLALAAAGLRVRTRPPALDGPFRHDGIVVLIIGAPLAAALIYAVVRLVSMRRGVWAGWRRRAAGLAIEPSGGADESDLAQAVASGQSALRRLDDARAAIIACYVAMEESLAGAGAARGAADTPDELLARAAGQGLVTGAAAARLTRLFYEARFSSHPVLPAERDAAERALADLAASPGGPEAVVGGRDREGG